MSEKFDLGSGHSFWYYTAYGEIETPYSTTWPDGVLHENLVGIIEHHFTPGGEPCSGSVPFAGYPRKHEDGTLGPSWEVVSLDPLELSPSIHCAPPEGCGSHGYIRGGRWVGC